MNRKTRCSDPSVGDYAYLFWCRDHGQGDNAKTRQVAKKLQTKTRQLAAKKLQRLSQLVYRLH